MNNNNGTKYYRVRIGGAWLATSERGWFLIIGIAFPLIAFLSMMPILSLFVFPTLIILSIYLRVRARTSRVPISESSRDILQRLDKIRTDVADAQHYIDSLLAEIQARSLEVTEKTEQTKKLDLEIAQSLSKYKFWRSLSEVQRSQVIDAARDAVTHQGAGRAVIFVLVTIVLNLAATLIWTLAGAPGRDELREFFMQLLPF